MALFDDEEQTNEDEFTDLETGVTEPYNSTYEYNSKLTYIGQR